MTGQEIIRFYDDYIAEASYNKHWDSDKLGMLKGRPGFGNNDQEAHMDEIKKCNCLDRNKGTGIKNYLFTELYSNVKKYVEGSILSLGSEQNLRAKTVGDLIRASDFVEFLEKEKGFVRKLTSDLKNYPEELLGRMRERFEF